MSTLYIPIWEYVKPERAPSRVRFLFEFSKQSVDDLHRRLLHTVRLGFGSLAHARMQRRHPREPRPVILRERASQRVRERNQRSAVVFGQPVDRFEVAAVDINRGPRISSRTGRLMLCTNPRRCPLSPPRSRYQRPPGRGSSTIGSGMPSGVSFSRPICAIKEAKVCSSVARTRISSVTVNVWLALLHGRRRRPPRRVP